MTYKAIVFSSAFSLNNEYLENGWRVVPGTVTSTVYQGDVFYFCVIEKPDPPVVHDLAPDKVELQEGKRT